MVAHAARDHATWSASSTERLWNCAGSLALTIDLPETTSEAADWGTCAHEIGEDLLFDRNKSADQWIGKTLKGKSHSFEVDEEMAETAQTYADYCWSRVDAYKAETGRMPLRFVEEKFSLEKLNPPFDAGGTSDHVLIFEAWKLIEVIDLKGGRGHVVEAIGNPQGRTYALGAMLHHEGIDVDRVMVTIVQPRAPHKDGRIRSDEFHISDLVEWTTDLVAAMKRSAKALAALPGGPPREVLSKDAETGEDLHHTENMPPAEWASTYLSPGDHCKFCKAKSTCPAIEKDVMDKVGLWFDELDQPRLTNAMSGDDPAQLSRDLDSLDMIEGWCNARRERAHMLAESGVEIPNYILVPKQGREKWNDGAEEQVIGAAVLAKLPEEKYLNPGKLRTPKQVRKELGKQASLVDGLSSTPSAGTNLVRADKTTRAAATPAVNQHFQAIE
jgi:hypothetical protein